MISQTSELADVEIEDAELLKCVKELETEVDSETENRLLAASEGEVSEQENIVTSTVAVVAENKDEQACLGKENKAEEAEEEKKIENKQAAEEALENEVSQAIKKKYR